MERKFRRAHQRTSERAQHVAHRTDADQRVIERAQRDERAINAALVAAGAKLVAAEDDSLVNLPDAAASGQLQHLEREHERLSRESERAAWRVYAARCRVVRTAMRDRSLARLHSSHRRPVRRAARPLGARTRRTATKQTAAASTGDPEPPEPPGRPRAPRSSEGGALWWS